jgi:hypothetical protein
MKVSELISALQLRDPNLEVYAYCDHSQTPEKVQYPKVIWAAGDVYAIWDGEYAQSEEEAEEEGYKVKAVLL